MSFNSLDFRLTMARFATGVTVVTTLKGQSKHGITVNSFTSLSLDPPLALICIDKRTESHDIIATSKVFTINILSEKQLYISDRFAGRDLDKRNYFDDIPLHVGINGCAIFDESIGYIECQLTTTYEGGDHSIYLGSIKNLGVTDILDADGQESNPLLYYKATYRHF